MLEYFLAWLNIGCSIGILVSDLHMTAILLVLMVVTVVLLLSASLLSPLLLKLLLLWLLLLLSSFKWFSHYHPPLPTGYRVTERDGEENPPYGEGQSQLCRGKRSGSADLNTSGGHFPRALAEHEAVPCWWQGVVTHQVLAGHPLQLQGVEAGAPAGIAEDAVSARPALGSWGGWKRAISHGLINQFNSTGRC